MPSFIDVLIIVVPFLAKIYLTSLTSLEALTLTPEEKFTPEEKLSSSNLALSSLSSASMCSCVSTSIVLAIIGER
jgi:hypothetical protein